ncbi:M20/M25/M40 family metallo-hydrolase [Bacillus thermotolerans]|uniref:Peptidase M42 family protein n=1 Tax=Bacillus thermotolerans TaxID=1221996 RepID=A0A0F5HJW6_BACTR|nr:M20/M25/M40 family metallo-hydrolase [Bacillus thermotolerans]KKB33591.1 peptidase M42 family protein [Bacillus thermotolerans]KKB41761.1 peptidase M42 family protein [Bacillus thermotolerans]KKB44347.1 peptidase M42 family protein [Bacillus thermotolerans]
MEAWNRLFIRQGFMVPEQRDNRFDCRKETEQNRTFLLESLDRLRVDYVYEQGILLISSAAVPEEEWLACVDFEHRGGGGWAWFRPGEEEPKVKELDTYISGVVRGLNRLGLHTDFSCDGHERRHPALGFAEWVDMEKAVEVLQAVGIPKLVVRNRQARLLVPRQALLDAAEKLYVIEKGWLREPAGFLNKQLFLHRLEQCLSINGASGKEEGIRNLVAEQLHQIADVWKVDRSGNLLAQKVYGTGQGPVILLNAHLDTVESFVPGRKMIKDGAVWSSSKGILGADDRAGVAVLLEVAERLKGTSFNGRVKFIFTVEEEVGLVGARGVDDCFLWDVDAAFVVDRRGKGDIVTSCGGYEAFCEESFGAFIEETAISSGLAGWKCTKGGSSDTRVWASHGIQSVNLSAGYQHEHTEEETLDTEACYGTVQLLLGIFQQARELKRVLRQIALLKRRNGGGPLAR